MSLAQLPYMYPKLMPAGMSLLLLLPLCTEGAGRQGSNGGRRQSEHLLFNMLAAAAGNSISTCKSKWLQPQQQTTECLLMYHFHIDMCSGCNW
jgi:hypothetical protein